MAKDSYKGGYSFRAELLGGAASGLMVRLPQLDDRIAVYQNGGPPFALAASDATAAVSDGSFVGNYEIVGRPGLDTPVYIFAA